MNENHYSYSLKTHFILFLQFNTIESQVAHNVHTKNFLFYYVAYCKKTLRK